MTIPEPNHPGHTYPLITIEFRDGVTVTAPLPVFYDQLRLRFLVAGLFGEMPDERSDDEFRDWITAVVDRAFGDLPDLLRALEEQEALAARFVVEGES